MPIIEAKNTGSKKCNVQYAQMGKFHLPIHLKTFVKITMQDIGVATRADPTYSAF